MAAKPWRLVDALEWGSKCLEEEGIEPSSLEARLLLGHVLKRKQDYLYLNFEELLSASNVTSFRNLVRRRKERIPWQYLTGHMEFMSLDFLVDKEVMIPRPETEMLVEAALRKVESLKSKVESWDSAGGRFLTPGSHLPTIIDIGTGSGNIAIALARALPCRVYALDISETALRVARANAARINVEEAIVFLREDMLALGKLEYLEGMVDLVVSNPPYVATGELGRLQSEVSRFEPRSALDGGEDGLRFYPSLIEMAAFFLRRDGYLALEIGINQAEAVKQLIIERSRFHYPEVIKDYSGIERIIIAQKQFSSASVLQ